SKSFSLVIVQRESVDNAELVLFQLEGEGGTKGSPKHLAGQVVCIVSWFRTKYRTAFAPQWIADFTDSRWAGAFLSPRFLSTAGNFGAGLRLVSARAVTREILFHRLMHQVLIDRTCKHRIRQFEFLDNFVLQVLYINCGH